MAETDCVSATYAAAVQPELSKRAAIHLQCLAVLSLAIQVASTWSNMNHDGLAVWLFRDVLLGSVMTFLAILLPHRTIITELKNEPFSPPLAPIGLPDVLRLPSLQTLSAFAASSFVLALRGLWTTSRHASFNRHWILYPEGRYGDLEPNENIAFILTYHVLLGCGYAWHRRISEQDKLIFPVVKRSLQFRLKPRIASIARQAAYSSFLSLLAYSLLYLVFGRHIYNLAGVTFKWMFWTKISKLRTFKLSYFDSSLLFHTSLNALICMLAWEWNDQLLKAIWTEIVSTGKATDSYSTLLAGLKSTKSYYRHLAHAEIANMIRHEPSRRADVYNDVVGTANGKGTTWLLIQSACRLTLEELDASVAKFGQGNVPLTLNQPPSAQEAFIRRARQPADPAIFLPVKATAVDSLLTSITRNGLQKRPAAITTLVTESESDTPLWLRNNPSDVAPVLGGPLTAGRQVATNSSTTAQLADLRTYVDTIWPTKISRSPPSVRFNPMAAKAKQLYNNFQIYIWAAEALSYIMVHSRKEDIYGIVANDLQTVLEAVIKSLDSVEKYISSVRLKGLASQAGMCPWEATSIAAALRTFVYAIVEAYYEYLPNTE
ncbi:hypothetical protein SeLEV6574_g05822 [Synchytrium endobioticum]|uniref:Nucleoporin NDC1 n=1 Tax=Synchytrium endobioticum TaxID=286115 RepID=A0A507CS66_9FUNG|nr:hypothetical protein SeLEV6574_g05822 [Synchytrium endobioticum]